MLTLECSKMKSRLDEIQRIATMKLSFCPSPCILMVFFTWFQMVASLIIKGCLFYISPQFNQCGPISIWALTDANLHLV